MDGQGDGQTNLGIRPLSTIGDVRSTKSSVRLCICVRFACASVQRFSRKQLYSCCNFSVPQAWAFMKLSATMDNALSHVMAYVLSRRTEISFHAEGVPDPLCGPWFSETGSPDDEASSTVDALRDTPVLHQEQFRKIESFLNNRFNSINNRPTLRTYWRKHRLVAVTETIHLGSVVAFAAVSHVWMRAVTTSVSNQETIEFRHMRATSDARNLPYMISQDDDVMFEGHVHADLRITIHRSRLVPPNL